MTEDSQKYISINGVTRAMTEQELTEHQATIEAAAQIVMAPTSITNAQLRMQLLADGVLDTIDTAIQNNTQSLAKKIQIEWEYSQTIARTSDLFSFVTTTLSLNEVQEVQFLVSASLL